MAGKAKCCCKLPHSVAVILLLFSMLPVLHSFTLRSLSGNVQQDHVVGEAAEPAVRTGSVNFKDEQLTSESASAATGNDDVPSDDSSPSEETENFIQTSQLQEAAWRRLHMALHCGETKMKFRAMGPGAGDLQLDTGNGYTLPLNLVPETCGYSMRQNALGLVLVVPYDGCSVLQENGNYVLLLRWSDNPVILACPVLQSPDETPDSVKPPLNIPPQKIASPHKTWTLGRQKRQVPQPSSVIYPSDPNYLYWYYYYYYLYLVQNYPYYYYPFPATTTVPPATTTVPPATTTVPPATTNTTPNTTTTTTTATTPTSTAATTVTSTVTTATSATSATEKPTPIYTLPEVPESGVFYYLPVIQNYYGNPPYQTIPPPTRQTVTVTYFTDEPETTTTQSETSPVTPEPTTTKKCTKKSTSSSSSSYEILRPYVEYEENPFGSVISFDQRSKAGPLPDFQRYMPEASYKSGFHAGAYPDFSGVAAPWFPYHTGYENIPT